VVLIADGYHVYERGSYRYSADGIDWGDLPISALTAAGLPAWGALADDGTFVEIRVEDSHLWVIPLTSDRPIDQFSVSGNWGPEEFVFDGAVQQAQLVLSVLLDIAADDTWPNWHDGQEFKAARDAMMTGGR